MVSLLRRSMIGGSGRHEETRNRSEGSAVSNRPNPAMPSTPHKNESLFRANCSTVKANDRPRQATRILVARRPMMRGVDGGVETGGTGSVTVATIGVAAASRNRRDGADGIRTHDP